MPKNKTYTVEFSTDELYSIRECLKELRKRIDSDYNSSHFTQQVEPVHNPLFVSACKLHFKLDKVENPKTKVTLQNYLNYGNYGKSN